MSPEFLPVIGEAPCKGQRVLPDTGESAEIRNNARTYRCRPGKLHVTEAGRGQAFMVATSADGAGAAEAARACYEQVAEVLSQADLEIVHERVFGSLSVRSQVSGTRTEALKSRGLAADGPLTYIQGCPPWGEGFAGSIIRAVPRFGPQGEVWTIKDGGMPVGRGWRRHGDVFLVLQNIQGLISEANGTNSRPLQAQCMLTKAARILETQGASYRDVVRTWLYLSDILGWYRDFNRARTAAYQEFGLIPRSGNNRQWLPASTGIAGDNPQGAAGALDLLAVVNSGKSRPQIKRLSNPGQPEAFTYGSAFSRGTLIREADVSLIQVSGTAAIDQAGKSLYSRDVLAQIDCTFDKIAALLAQAGATLADIGAACVFVKRPEDALVYQKRAQVMGLENLPAVVLVADICRNELLFEIDAEVVLSHKPEGPCRP